MLFAVFFDHALQWRDFFLWFQFGGPATEAQLFDRILANHGDFLVAAFLDREEMVFVFQQHNTLLGYFAGNLGVFGSKFTPVGTVPVHTGAEG